METDKKNSASLPPAAHTRTSSDHITGQMKTGALTTTLLFAAILYFYASVTNASHTIITEPDTAWRVCNLRVPCPFRVFPTSEFSALEACKLGANDPLAVVGPFNPPLENQPFNVIEALACADARQHPCSPNPFTCQHVIRLERVCLPPFQVFREPGQPLESFKCIGPGPHEDQFVIRLSPTTGSPESADIITSVEPDQTTETLVVRVFNAETEELVPNVDVRLELDIIANSGGHNHHDDDRPKGKLSSSSGQLSEKDTVLTGNTGAGGLEFTLNAPAPAGDHTIMASCTDRTCMPDRPNMIDVGVKGLITLPSSGFYVLLENRDTKHPDNHHMTTRATGKIGGLAKAYNKKFPNDFTVRLNDASLERGGIFDFDFTGRTIFWKEPHKRHRRGLNIDIRANPAVNPDAIPEDNFLAFEGLAIREGCTAEPHETGKPAQHYHVTCP